MGAKRREAKQINFRVSDAEYKRIAEMATNTGMTVPSFCKSLAKGKKMKAPKIDRVGAREISSELRHIGVNVNQIAKYLNTGQNVSTGLLEPLTKELNKLWQLLSSELQK